MKTDLTYDSVLIAEICDEISLQWENHLMTRAVFPFDCVEHLPSWRSSDHCRFHGMDFTITVNNPNSPLMKRALKDVPRWLNQNFIIRLFGLLEQNGVIRAGKEAKNPFTGIVARLRHVLAHTSGNPMPDDKTLQTVARLLNEHFNSGMDLKSVRDFNLNVKLVLQPLKDRCIEFVQSLTGKPIPQKASQQLCVSLPKELLVWLKERARLANRSIEAEALEILSAAGLGNRQ